MKYEIESDIPIPSAATRPAIYPFADLKPGDSFAVPCTLKEQKELTERLRAAAQYYVRKARKNGSPAMRYVVRPVIEKDQHLVRCWCQKR